MGIVVHPIRSAAEFMDRYLPDGPAGGLFLDRRRGLTAPQRVDLRLDLRWLGESHHVQGTVERDDVIWFNCGVEARGCVVRLDADEGPTRQALLARVRASTEQVSLRGADRLPTYLEVHYFDAEQQPRPGTVLDLSPTGAYVRSSRPLPTGADIYLRLEDRQRRVLRHVRGRVVRLDFGRGTAGMGVAFHFARRRDRADMVALCAHLATPLAR